MNQIQEETEAEQQNDAETDENDAMQGGHLTKLLLFGIRSCVVTHKIGKGSG